ncbi:MAG: radical SAM protein [Desulfobulbaceae bacterium]|nr:radical SAM protein [Desulfobulbaceae bacterium]
MPVRHPQSKPHLVFANAQGEIIDYSGLHMVGAAAGRFYLPEARDLIELPTGSEIFTLPVRSPVGLEPDSGDFALLAENPFQPGDPVQAVAAFMAPAYTALYSAAFVKQEPVAKAPLLPLFAYTAVGWAEGKFWVTAFRSDADVRQDANQFNLVALERRTKKQLKRLSHNRLVQHLGTCCLVYGCPAARNYFLGRWEAPLPCSPVCNAACAGCISLQPSGCCSATQERITFVPSSQEIAEIAVPHLRKAAKPVVSFGQGCEGEPLLQAQVMEQAIRLIRKETSRGTINLNTNGSLPAAVERLAAAGLDAIRLSLNSAQPEHHHRYYQPKGFTLNELCTSLDIMKDAGRHVSLNYFILPGCTDDPREFAALSRLLERHRPDLIQLRNLNMDPDYYRQVIGHRPDAPPMGMRAWLQALKSRFPWLRFGYYNPALR